MNGEKQTFIKVKGEEYAWGAINVVRNDETGWVSFDRYNTKTDEIVGHVDLQLDQVVSIETR